MAYPGDEMATNTVKTEQNPCGEHIVLDLWE